MTPQEIKREVSTPELTGSITKPAPEQPLKRFETPSPEFLPQSPPPPPPVRKQPGIMSLRTLSDIKFMDDLKKIEVGHLRQAPVSSQIQAIRSKIILIAQANKMLPYYAVVAFEASPLFRAYLDHGNSKFSGTGSRGDLTQEEFEAVADLRKEIERL
jgi:hypothetical protein